MNDYDHVSTEAEALGRAVVACALHGQPHTITNANLDVAWNIEPDTKVDNDDLTFPVIVHMRGGTIASDGLAILLPEEVAR